MSFFLVSINLFPLIFCATSATDMSDCKSTVVVGLGPNTLIDFIGQLSVNFAQNRTENGILSKIVYYAKTVPDSKTSLLTNSDDPPIFIVTIFLWPTVEENTNYPELKLTPIAAR